MGKDLTPAQRARVVLTLHVLADAQGGVRPTGRLPRGLFTLVARKLNYSDRTVRRLWKEHKDHAQDPELLERLGGKRRGRCGRRPLDVRKFVKAVYDVPPEERLTVRSAAAKAGVSRSTLWRKLGKGIFVSRTSRLKPTLTPASRAARLRFCLDMLHHDEAEDVIKFDPLVDTIFVDEKWFFIDLIRRRYILLPDEAVPAPTTRHKSHIVKFMFLSAVARPRRDVQRNQDFNGKLGIWPFVARTTAIRNSKVRKAGTPIVTPTTVNRDAYRDMLVRKLVPAIMSKWPRDVKIIRVQQDNAGPHVKPGLLWEGNGLTVTMVCQPASSPDFNILDLGYFNAIQALQQKRRCKTVEDLLRAVELSFRELPRQSLENVFYSLWRCMEASMVIGGRTTYKLPHSNKAKLRKTPGALEQLRNCSLEAWLIATEDLEELERNATV
ncbi:hypothetical protein ACHHYP_16321 [Achlya hypogyna]|uniref:Transposase Tc1-like domain-containing protein n=1 Tax=Achlya hypogyna TaxID=1202772 RepID=A0A1V9Y9C5_ACHHY|nr:hypothetical protein ACHHYP_16321 [Achlya hypogyna]